MLKQLKYMRDVYINFYILLHAESSTDPTCEQFRELDLLVEQKDRSVQENSCNSSKSTRTHALQSSEDSTQLDDLLAEQHETQQGNSKVHHADSQETDTFSSLEKLYDNVKHVGNVQIPECIDSPRPIEFAESHLLVPHVPYSLLREISDHFSDRPYLEGGRRLGAGAFGVVYKADISSKILLMRSNQSTSNASETESRSATEDDNSVTAIAIKKLNVSDDRVEEQFKVEVEMLSECCHLNILSLEGYSCDGPQWCLLYAFMVNGNLQDRLACSDDFAPLTSLQRLIIGRGTAHGLAYLHTFKKIPMIHRDVKSANILLDENLLPKMGDFGLIREGENGTHTETIVQTSTVFGTSAYMAPEAFRGDVSTKLDSFSYGVVVLEILTGLAPYDEHREGRDLLSHVQDSDDEPDILCDTKGAPWPSGLPEDLYNLAMTCFEDRKARPSMVKLSSECDNLLDKWKEEF